MYCRHTHRIIFFVRFFGSLDFRKVLDSRIQNQTPFLSSSNHLEEETETFFYMLSSFSHFFLRFLKMCKLKAYFLYIIDWFQARASNHFFCQFFSKLESLSLSNGHEKNSKEFILFLQKYRSKIWKFYSSTLVFLDLTHSFR